MSSVAAAVRRVVWNDRERRPRTPWRLALGAVVVVAVGVAATVPLVLLGALRQDVATVPAAVLATTAQVAVYGALTAGVLAAAWFVDRRFLRDLGLAPSRVWWRDFGFGLALGVAMPAVVFALEVALGYATVTGVLVRRTGATLPPSAGGPVALAFALTAGYFVAVGLFEELLFRGYLLTNVAEGFRWIGSRDVGLRRIGLQGIGRRGNGLREVGSAGAHPRQIGQVGTGVAIAVATVTTSVVFGLVHGANPNATVLAVLFISLYGGFLAAGYLLTGRIAVPVGVHVTWNLSVSSVFGFPVSGVTTPVTLVAVEVSGPRLVTGGAFGPEGGLVSLVALGVGLAALVGRVRWREGRLRIHDAIALPALRFESDGEGDRESVEAPEPPSSTDSR